MNKNSKPYIAVDEVDESSIEEIEAILIDAARSCKSCLTLVMSLSLRWRDFINEGSSRESLFLTICHALEVSFSVHLSSLLSEGKIPKKYNNDYIKKLENNISIRSLIEKKYITKSITLDQHSSLINDLNEISKEFDPVISLRNKRIAHIDKETCVINNDGNKSGIEISLQLPLINKLIDLLSTLISIEFHDFDISPDDYHEYALSDLIYDLK